MAIFLSLFFLFLLFLGFAALVILHFLITSTAFRRRHRHRRRRSPPLVFPEEIPYCGGVSQHQSSIGDCAICLDGFKDGEYVRKLPDCGHVFHVKCVDSWLTRVLNCPVCRARVRVGSGDSVMSDEDWKRWWAVGVSG
ncbi:RING-H2 finger protein ATL56 [Lycium ferocissimum]|uniref:RING-H2 finger protein ATL56 n=1 Tax=Lycium ferocissimum TaxID=112874 RepID=UPI0028168DF9|nr:RING-H2 finger protein ATL56 [Lycium ferocissimum]